MKKLFKRVQRQPVVPILVSYVLAFVIRVIGLSLRIRVVDPEGVLAKGRKGGAIFPFWHNRMVLVPFVVPRHIMRRISVLASRSRDGAFISATVRRFGVSVVRGSTSKGGATAVAALKTVLEEGRFVGVTPDGPRGPCYEIKTTSLLWLARKANVPIYPVSINFQHFWQFKTWDRTQFPKPFSKGELVVGNMLSVEDLAEIGDEEFCQLLTARLNAITDK